MQFGPNATKKQRGKKGPSGRLALVLVMGKVSILFSGTNKISASRAKNSDYICLFTEKWKVPSAIGKINVVKKFDDTFFGIHSGVADMMDPLTRVSIERAYEAIMDAGLYQFLKFAQTHREKRAERILWAQNFQEL